MKKRLIPIFITVVMLISVCASFALPVSAAAPSPYISVPLAENNIIIDGEKGTEYDKAVTIPVKRILAYTDGYTPVEANVSFMWGADHSIYVYAEVIDDSVVTNSQNLINDFGVKSDNVDCVEIYMYWGNGEQIIQYKVTSDGKLYCYQQAHNGDTPSIQESGDANERFDAAVKMTDVGYDAEFKIKSNLVALSQGAMLSFKVVVVSTDDENSGICSVTNFGNPYTAQRYHKKNVTSTQAYANMMLVDADGADDTWRKYPTIKTPDESRFNDDKTTQNLQLRSATFISDTEIIVEWSKPCTLQWFNYAPPFVGVCDKPYPSPVSPYQEGSSWQIGCDLSSIVTNDGGLTWKLTLSEPRPTDTGVFRVSETNGNDVSYYGTNNTFIGHIISLDGQDYLHAANDRPDYPDNWDVTSVAFNVDTTRTWDATNETPLPSAPVTIEHTDEYFPAAFSSDPVRESIEESKNETPDDKEPTGDNGDDNPDDSDDPTGDNTDNKDNDNTQKPPVGGNEDGGFPIWIIIVIAAVVVIAVVVIVVAKKKK